MFRSLCLALFLAASGSFWLETATPPCCPAKEELPTNPVIESMLESSVTIKGLGGGIGSGLILVRGPHAFVLTAGHCVEDLHQVDETTGKDHWQQALVYQTMKQEGVEVGRTSYKADLLLYSPFKEGQDIAVLHLKVKNRFKKGVPFYLDKKLPPLGTKLFHCGASLGELGADSVIPGFYSQHGRMLGQEIFDQITCNAFPGSSGGMVTLEDGRLVGIVTRGERGGFILIKPIRVIKKLLDENNFQWLYDSKVPLPKEYQ